MSNLRASAGFAWRKNSWPTSTCFEGGKQDFSSSKGDAGGILSEFRHRCISTPGFLEDGCSGWLKQLPELSGLKLCSDRIWALFGFLLNWNRGLSHGWIHTVSKTFLSRTS